MEAAVAVLRDAALAHPGRIVLATSLGAEDQVVTALIAQHRLPIALVTLQTGRLHAQTLALLERTEQHHGLPIERHAPPETAVLQFVQRHGVDAMRREQSPARAEVAIRSLDDAGRVKFSPLADWSNADVWQVIADLGIPYNPLHDAFMPSIGCEPCTRAVALGEDPRAGRWWWEQDRQAECGLHLSSAEATS